VNRTWFSASLPFVVHCFASILARKGKFLLIWAEFGEFGTGSVDLGLPRGRLSSDFVDLVCRDGDGRGVAAGEAGHQR
jgi:hypothetical protein